MDFNQYNVSAKKVYFYRNYPNRQGTPKRIERPSTMARRSGLSIPYITSPERLREMLKTKDMEASDGLRASILCQFYHDKLPPLPLPHLPKIVNYKSPQDKFIINDYHRIETNGGYGRTTIGGFYMH